MGQRGRKKGSGGGPNKSLAVRNYLSNHPNASTQDIIDGLAKDGIEVYAALIGGIKAKGEFDGSSWHWSGRKSKTMKSVDSAVTEHELTTLEGFIEKIDAEMDLDDIIKGLTPIIKKIGGIDRFEKVYDYYLSSESDSENEDEDEEDKVLASVANSDDDDDEAEEQDEVDDDDDDE